jgi:hypothetical protein
MALSFKSLAPDYRETLLTIVRRSVTVRYFNNNSRDRFATLGVAMTFKSIFDPGFKYRTAVFTDVRQTFQRVRREQAVNQQRAQPKERRLKVVPIEHEERRRSVIPMSADMHELRRRK